jgi:signal transduction histidine kinase
MRTDRLQVIEETYPELATAVRLRSDRIVQSWEGLVRRAVPSPAAGLELSELRDNLPEILGQMADTFETASAREHSVTAHGTPSLGSSRYRQKYLMRDLLAEDRLLRRAVIEHVGSALCRPMLVAESVALNAAMDLVVQQEVLAFCDCEKDESRSEAEAELKHISFFAHEMNNNLNAMGLQLRVLRDLLAQSPEYAEDVACLDEMQEAIRETAAGMRHLQEYERLRNTGIRPEGKPVCLQDVAAVQARFASEEAASKGLNLVVDVSPDAQVISDHALVAIVLRNLLGNAIKYSSAGTVRIHAEYRMPYGQTPRWALAVTDEGPGIGPEESEQIFRAFRRGEPHGQTGHGLGLAIASQAAKLLGAELSLESEVGRGSTFRLTFPAT